MGKESSDSGTQESEDSDQGSHDSRGHNAPTAAEEPRIERLVWKMLLPTRELAGSGGRRFLLHTNNPSSPAPRTVREWARPPHDALPPSP